MSRGTSLTLSYLQAIIFTYVAIRCFLAWQRDRDARSAHLAIATGIFATSSFLGAITSSFINAQNGEVAPQWEQILSTTLLYLSVYAFLVFLSDFIPYPAAIHGLIIVATLAGIVLAFIERPDIRFDLKHFKVEKIPGIHNPITYGTYVKIVLVYLIVAFGALAVSFFVYGLRSRSLARFRMISLALGFALFCLILGLLPRLLDTDTPSQTIKNLLNVFTYVALAIGPLLLLGFTPPKFIRSMFGDQQTSIGASP